MDWLDREIEAFKDFWIFLKVALVAIYFLVLFVLSFFNITGLSFLLVLGVFFLWRLFAFRKEPEHEEVLLSRDD